jgi:hypothetical protein
MSFQPAGWKPILRQYLDLPGKWLSVAVGELPYPISLPLCHQPGVLSGHLCSIHCKLLWSEPPENLLFILYSLGHIACRWFSPESAS